MHIVAFEKDEWAKSRTIYTHKDLQGYNKVYVETWNDKPFGCEYKKHKRFSNLLKPTNQWNFWK
jgi:hypothetical protein